MSLGRNTTYNLIGSLVPIALSLVTVPAYLSLIGVDRYGVLAISWLLLGYFGVFDLGLGRATIHRIAELKDAPAFERLRTLHTAAIVNLGMGLVGGIVLALGCSYFFLHQIKIPPGLRSEMLYAAPLLGLSLPVATLTGVLTGALQGRERFAATNIIGTVSTVAFQTVPLLFAWVHGPGLSGLLLAGILTRIATLGVLWQACRREFGGGRGVLFGRDQVGVLLRFGGWITVTALIAPFLTIIDRFAIGAVLGATAVAYYSVPYQFASRISILPMAMTNALFPRLSGLGSAEEQGRLARDVANVLTTIITLPVLGGIILVGPALALWVGPTFAIESATSAKLLLIAFWLNALALVSFTNLQARGRPDLVTFILAAEVPFYIAALWAGLHFGGLPGCAAAFIFRCGLDYMLLSRFSAKGSIAWRSLLVSGALFAGAIGVTERWTPENPLWYMLNAALIAAGSADTWASAPPAMRDWVLSLRARLVRSRQPSA